MRVSADFKGLAEVAGVKLKNSTELYPALHGAGDRGLQMLVVGNGLGRAVIALQGAHVMAFEPAGGREMLWVSPKCVLEAGKPIRGGIPLCLPWFGPIADGSMMHGFARVMEWTPVTAEACADGSTRVVLELASDAVVTPLWPHAFRFRLEIVVGSSLKMSLSAENRSGTAASLAFAFHSYFKVQQVTDARVSGLEGKTFIDKADSAARKVQRGDVTITALTDRVYLDVPALQVLKTAAGDVKIESEAKCAVVWNAWTNDKNMADIGEGNHVGYLCVERGDVADFAVTLAAGDIYGAKMTLSF
jgi:D-hexose-6-phosphate mutarotase